MLTGCAFFTHRFRIACDQIKETPSGIHAAKPYLAVLHLAIMGECRG
jgi:hypothetical protein